MTIILDDVSEPGSRARAMARGCLPGAVDYEPEAVSIGENVKKGAAVRHDLCCVDIAVGGAPGNIPYNSGGSE